ncbi:pullulanase [Clostridium punense]|uniref:Pullulanase n=1 Tax=Clostridium punense TaxID=1054297 RepID=A0ABS4K435_9CLOT|nr:MULTISPECIES: glycoside hydrolase family 13 protein [Clostridium]EQB87571.1 hypothetical protein M918_08430 [Clostridium sp. BL8]MBP2021394.1 pullulanase [Clostridium punense]
MDNLKVFFNSHDLSYRNPFGAVVCGSKVFFRIYGSIYDEINLELYYGDEKKEKISMEKCGEYFSIEVKFEKPQILWYYFSLKQGETYSFYGNNQQGLGGIGEFYYSNPKPYQITVYEDFKIPSWYKEGIIYQIFVDSFNNGFDSPLNPKNNSFIYGNWYDDPMYIKDSSGNIIRWAFYGGNLQGVIEKLSYLKSLGVTAIYLNPIFEASSVHKYDTGDYLKIDPMFGDEDKFQELCLKAMEKGIRIILDGVFSHTGDDSVYFNKYGSYPSVGAYESSESLYYSWYRFKTYPEDYECWWGVKSLPNVNELEQSYMDFIINSKNSVVNKWLKLGASGWRLDVADELPDDFIKAFKKKIKEVKEDSVLIGEVWEDASNKISYGERREYLLGRELDSVMNYPFRNLTLDFLRGYIEAEEFSKKVMSLLENYPKEVFYGNMNLLGTHDTERLLTIFKDYTEDETYVIALLKLATLLQMTFPGVPSIYYGDEAGLTGGKDPFNRKAYPWNRENKDMMHWYRLITSIRSSYAVFKKGELKLHMAPSFILCYERIYEDERAIVILNRSFNASCELEINLVSFNGEFENLLCKENKKEKIHSESGILKISIGPLQGKVLIGTAFHLKRSHKN